RGNSQAANGAVEMHQMTKIVPQEVIKLGWRMEGQPVVGQTLDLLIVMAFSRTMRIATALMTPDIAVERGADVPKFVNDRRELVAERAIEKSRQIETQQIEHLLAVVSQQRTNRPGPAA